MYKKINLIYVFKKSFVEILKFEEVISFYISFFLNSFLKPLLIQCKSLYLVQELFLFYNFKNKKNRKYIKIDTRKIKSLLAKIKNSMFL